MHERRLRTGQAGEGIFRKRSYIEIHDTVLIAAALYMYNGYVDGLDTRQPATRHYAWSAARKQRVRVTSKSLNLENYVGTP